MSERRDDTTEPSERDAPPERERRPQNYYYDDGTGYEVYDPAKDEDDEDDNRSDTQAPEILERLAMHGTDLSPMPPKVS